MTGKEQPGAPQAPGVMAEAILAWENRALELIAGDAPLAQVLDELTRFIESQDPGLVCSVLVLEGGRLRHGAAPSLPEAYNQAIDGLTIGPQAGSCGTAAFTAQPVVVTDITTDPRWAPYPEVRALAVGAGLRACWSTPILDAGGGVLGTFAMYYRSPSPPSPSHLRLVQSATHIAGIAIDRHRTHLALADRAARLAEADRRKDEFLAMLGHELRNPLAPIVVALSLMRAHEEDPSAVARYRAVVERQVHQLTRLVDDLLDVSRISSGKIVLRPESTNIRAALTVATEAVRGIFEQRKITLSVCLPDEPIPIVADPVRLAQVLGNLLTNAGKYTDPGGHVDVRVAREGGDVVVSVRDDGIGIPADVLARVFDPFVQSEAAREKAQGGLGLGLTLVKRLVEMHGGRVEVKSAGAGRGTEAIVRLPAAARAA